MTTPEMTAARRGLRALYLEAPEDVARDLSALVEAAFLSLNTKPFAILKELDDGRREWQPCDEKGIQTEPFVVLHACGYKVFLAYPAPPEAPYVAVSWTDHDPNPLILTPFDTDK